MIHNLLIAVAIANLTILVGYSIYFFSKLTFYKSKESLFNKPISIIICAKNEAENLRNFLPKVLGQDFPEFEVIVVNDNSFDDTKYLLEALVL